MSAIEVIDGSATGSEYFVPRTHAKGWLAFYKPCGYVSPWSIVHPEYISGSPHDWNRTPTPLHSSRQSAIDIATKYLPTGGAVKVFEIDLGEV